MPRAGVNVRNGAVEKTGGFFDWAWEADIDSARAAILTQFEMRRPFQTGLGKQIAEVVDRRDREGPDSGEL